MLEQLDALACACRSLYVSCWTTPIASMLPSPADVLRVLCRLGFLHAYCAALPLHDSASQLLSAACDRHRIPKAATRGTLLHAAVLSENPDMVAAVIKDFGHRINVPDSHGQTPLYLASVYRRAKGDADWRSEHVMVKLLLEGRADPDAYSGRHGAVQVQRTCSDHFNPHTALVMACRRCDLKMVKTLLQYRADVQNCEVGGGGEGLTPVSATVRWNRTYEKAAEGCRPKAIHDALHRVRVLGALVAAGSDVDGLVPEEKGIGRTALHIAVRDEPTGLLAARLLQARACVNTCDECRDSPLHAAFRYGHTDCLRVLLAARADLTAQDMDGKTPSQVAPGLLRTAAFDRRVFTRRLRSAWL
jgi:ankyrin repeat protein